MSNGTDQTERAQSHSQQDSNEMWRRIYEVDQRVHEIEKTIAKELATINANLASLLKMAQTFINKDQFAPVKLLAYGLATIILTGVLGALLAKLIWR